MAPITRKTASSGASRQVHRKGAQGKPSADAARANGPSNGWELVRTDDDSDDDSDASAANGRLTDPINPLRAMADRVGREVDHFAETLDRFNDSLHGPDAYDAARDLTAEYKEFAEGMVRKLKTRHDAQRVSEMKNEFGKRIPQSPQQGFTFSTAAGKVTHNDGADDMPAQTSLGTLKQWQAEADTWELFRIMLDLKYSPGRQQQQQQQERASRLAQLGTPNSYASDADVWERFTLSDDLARERHLVLKWLQRAADHGESDIEAIAEELERKSGRGKGLWSNGWMETREKLKAAKRMRFGPSDQLHVKRSDTNELVVSSLDPDAPARQRRTLEKADAYSERSLWMTCWEMLRRGRSWAEICQWCSDRNQSWRAASLGASSESGLDVGLPGVSGGALWRRMCYALVRDGTSDEYEAAVYGILSGDLDSVKHVCRTWDDHVYAHYNSLLVSQLDGYLQKDFPQRFGPGLATKFGLFDSLRRHGLQTDVARTLVRQLAEQPSTSNESRQPLKLLQGSLIADTFSDLCNGLAVSISDAAWYSNPSTVIVPLRTAVAPDSTSFPAEGVITADYEALRIVTHMMMLLREFYPPLSNTQSDPDALDNIIAAYIQFLRAAGKWELTPLYASRMSALRSTRSLAQIISDVQDIQEKVRFINLMKVYNIDPIAVLVEQAKYLVEEVLPKRPQAQLKIIETSAEDIYPGQRIKLDFTSAGSGGEGIAENLSVFYLIEGHWDVAFETLSFACRKLLLNGCFREASALVTRLSFESLSAAKTRPILGQTMNVMDHDETTQFLSGPGKQHTDKLTLLQRQSRTYHELNLLVKAVDALENWREKEHDYASKVPRPNSVPPKVKSAFEDTCSAVEPVLGGILLTARDDAEAEDLKNIRNMFLPEVILAYNAVLCAAAHMISRDSLLRSMELANDVANDKNGLADCFVQTGRMRELVTSLAHSSETMLKLNEVGKGRREKKNKTGRNLAIWEIGG